jgi:uncharacterized protein YeaO (DUF488 family)
MKQIKIKTKSILRRKSKFDGLRVCVMRRIKPGYKFDIWLPKIAPSDRLVDDYIVNEKISWEKFAKKYRASVLSKNGNIIELLYRLAKKEKITLLCFEDDISKCHRKLIIDEINLLKSKVG